MKALLGPVERIPLGEGKAFEIEGDAVTVFRTRKNSLFATQSRCPHRAGPLADGILGDSTVVCPLHGFKFDLSSGCAVEHSCGALKTYPLTVNAHGEILLELEPS